jgi:site-specific DNA recombinase
MSSGSTGSAWLKPRLPGPLGYDVKDRKLVANAQADDVRWIFARFVEIGSATVIARELKARGIAT